MSIASPEAVVIGMSAGGLDALSNVLPPLPEDYPLPILVTSHLPAGRESSLSELLSSKCRVSVTEVEDKEPIRRGVVYLAPPDYHLLVDSREQLSLSVDRHVNFSRPSIDVLFESAAEVYGEALVGIILTGANHDGAQGLKRICEYAGTAIVQNPELSHSSEMPRAALASCPGARVMSLKEIAGFLLEVVEGA